ncbi:GL26413 [Drosophila persimilis]|uniref:GL26413 n=1 Tax=Drosophila persimilis TaxID=7234 RepID=B4GSV1_DROPE|nr:uncharacterized protein LOC6596436 [Drosophila persimilis]EDW25460.1 GL26413 [Drosophila persimilis]
MDESELIKLIKNCPILYDKDSARSVKNAALKDAAWKTISQKIGASERACITRWKSIRDRFGKEFRRFQENPEVPTYWDMFPHLLFLKDHYKHGLVRHESLEGIKFQPKVRRKRNYRLYEEHEKNPKAEEEDCKDDILSELIELVKMHPVLYDKDQIRISKNLSAKNEAWREISERLNVSEEICFKHWKKLRERFAREYRNQQIDQSTPITWKHFNDLLFLDKHFRKGVPLVIENMKKRGRPPKASNQTGVPDKQTTSVGFVNGEQIWGADYPYSTDNDEQDNDLELSYDDPDEIEFAPEPEQTTAYDFILPETAPSQHLAPDVSVELLPYNESFDLARESSTVEDVGIATEDDTPAATSGNLLDHVISNMETVLQQSRELQAQLQQEQQRPPAIKSLLAKAQMLLDGLSPKDRSTAVRQIGLFVHQCQIKALAGEEIEDLTPYQVFNC